MIAKKSIFRHPTVMLPLLICLIGAGTAAASIATLLNAAIAEEETKLTQIVRSQARLMESVAKFDALHSINDHPDGAFIATLRQIVAAHASLDGFGATGEFVIGKMINGKIAVLQAPRFESDVNFQVPDFVPVPMQKALAGEAGHIVATDYKGHQVLASYEPVAVLNIGLVAKIDTAEVYRPFITSSIIVAAITLVMLALGVYASRLFSGSFVQLEHAKKRAEEYLDIASTIMMALDKNGCIEMMNRKGCHVLGYDESQLLGKNWFDLAIADEHQGEINTVFAQIMNGNLEPVEHYENAIMDCDGNSHMIAWNNSYIRDEKGAIVGCLSAGRDVTQPRQVEAALRVSETRFTKSQGFANIGTWDWNVQTGELYWSPQIAPLFGYAQGELETTYDNFVGAIHPDDREAVTGAVTACVEKGIEYNIEHRVVWPDGAVRWLHERGDVVRDENGEPMNMLGVVQDITARKWAEDEILRLSRRNELILNAAGDGIYGVDLQGRCTFINPAATAMLGFAKDELLGRDLHALLHHTRADGGDYPVSDCPIYLAFKDGKVRTVSDEVFWCKDGSSFPVEYTSTPIFEGDTIMGAVVVFRDVSEGKALQAQLIQSSKMATLGEMATGVAHELNQPLNVIRMAVNNVQNKVDKGTADPRYLTDKLTKVVAQVERAAAIIDHMRIFGRKPSSEMALLDPVEMVAGATGLIGEQLRLSGVDVTTEAANAVSKIRGHQVQIEQVLLNLLANAQYVLNGKDSSDKRIAVRVANADHGKMVRIEVEDNGGGIAGEHLARIFEPFFTTKEIGKGTGLGLSISYGIINEMGGTLEVRNTERGACFTITVPSELGTVPREASERVA